MFKNNKVKYFSLIILVCATFPVYSQLIKQKWFTISSEPFIIYYHKNNKTNANLILNTLSHFYPRLSTELGIESTFPIKVYVITSKIEYNQILRLKLPEWSAGAAFPAQQTILIHFDRHNNEPAKTAVHELVHILLHHRLKDKNIPRWLDEGLAVFYSGEKELASSSLISKALLTNSIIQLDEIDHVLSYDKTKAQLAYQQSYLAVTFIVNKYTIKSIRNLVSNIEKEEHLDSAFLKTFNMDTWDFEVAWIKYIKQKYRWYFLLDFDTYLWMLILMLFIVIFLIIRWRNRQTLKRWEEEEKEFDYDEI